RGFTSSGQRRTRREADPDSGGPAGRRVLRWRSPCTGVLSEMTSPDKPELLNNPQLRSLLRMCKLDRTFVTGEGVWLTDAAGRRRLVPRQDPGRAVADRPDPPRRGFRSSGPRLRPCALRRRRRPGGDAPARGPAHRRALPGADPGRGRGDPAAARLSAAGPRA